MQTDSILNLGLNLRTDYVLPAGIGDPPQEEDRMVQLIEISGPSNSAKTRDKATLSFGDAERLEYVGNPTSADRLDSS